MSHKNSSNSYNPGNTSLHNKGKAWLALAFIMLIAQIYIVYCSYIKATVLFLAFAAFWIDVLIMDEEGGKMHMSRARTRILA